MMRSLFSGVSGLRVHQSRMDVIGNNIANVNTVGFKASRMTFADAMLQRVSGASADNPETGRAGRNPMQIGLGVNIGSIDNLMMQGAAQRTDRPLDLTIQGEGFFIVEDERGQFFTRAGNVDWNGHRFSIGGMQLMGWPAVRCDAGTPGGYRIQQGNVAPLETPASRRFMNPTATSLIEVVNNLNINDRVMDPGPLLNTITRPVAFYDTIGNRWIADVRFTWHPPENASDPPPPAPHSTNAYSLWTMDFVRNADGEVGMFPHGLPRTPENQRFVDLAFTSDEPEAGAGDAVVALAFSPLTGNLLGAEVGATPAAADAALLAAINGPDQTPRGVYLNFVIDPDNTLAPPSVIGGLRPPGPDAPTVAGGDDNTGSIRMYFGGLRAQQGEPTDMRAMFMNGNRPGSLQDIMIGPDGIIMGRFSNGETSMLGQIPLAKFLNPAGLERMGNNLWATTPNSGWFDGVGNHGEMMAGTLEMSNVDLSSEFTEMITTQRGFQANSRVITTSDEMLMELVNLRR